MPYFFQHFGVAVGALTGVLAGEGKRVDLFGILVLGVVTGLGGGTLRDIILGLQPVVWVRDPSLLHTAIIATLIGFILARVWNFAGRALLVADAVALALYAVAGVEVAMQAQGSAVVAIAMGVVTGVAGGVVRDALIGEIPLVFRADIYLYATAALAGSALYAGLRVLHPGSTANMWIAAAVIFTMRMGAIVWKWTLPAFHLKKPEIVDAGGE